ncbi:MAG: hypothetical protein HGA85_02845 [Nanoarchaeota archaeon]|nr:hypothetical protein [Nanoarchaeota archaeon]
MTKKLFKYFGKWNIAIEVMPIVILACVFKILTHNNSWEILSLSPLFTSILAATTFLIGFLITGVISDYKESEKIPGDLAASLEVIHDETSQIAMTKQSKEAKAFLLFQLDFISSLKRWFFKREETGKIFDKLNSMNNHFAKLEAQTQVAYISRMKQEQSNIRKMVSRINTLRDTQFAATAYAIAEFLAFFLVVGMITVKIEPFYESMFFLIIVTFLVWYMILLIKDFDNPFEYAGHGEQGSEISLKPIHDLEKRLERYVKEMEKAAKKA